MTFSQKLFLTESAWYLYEKDPFDESNVNKCQNSCVNIEEWKNRLDGETDSYFEKRLRMQNISEKNAVRLLEKNKAHKPAEWTYKAEKLLDLMPSKPNEIISKLKYITLDAHSDFYAYLSPVLLYVQQELSDIFQIKMISQNACKDIMTNLFEHIKFIFERFGKHRINKTAGMILPQPVENLSEYYWKFSCEMVGGGYEKCFLEYPCLARSLIETLDLRISFIKEAVLNFCKDKPFDGQITSFKLSAGDVHNYGRSVIIAEYNSETIIVYKPQNGEVYAAYGKLLNLLHKHCILCEMKYAEVISSYSDHCYIEYIRHDPITDGKKGLNRFYYRIGQLTCLFYVLGSEDMHYENIIACGEYPVAIDLETLLTAKANKFYTLTDSADTDKISMATRSMLLTFKGLRSGAPLLEGNILNAAYCMNGDKIDFEVMRKNIIKGFNNAYSNIRANKEIFSDMLSVFDTCKFRSIIRSTQTYCDMLKHLQYVKYLKNGLIRSFEAERLFAAYRDIENSEKLKSMYPVFKDECMSILRGDVPIFGVYANKCTIISTSGKLNENFFELSPINNAKAILFKMSGEDQIAQIKIIQMVMNSVKRVNLTDYSNSVSQTNILSDSRFVEEAEKIFDTVIGRRIFHDNGLFYLNVYSDDSNVKMHKVDICVANNSMYSGLLGFALFCGALFYVTNKIKYKVTATEITDKVIGDFIYTRKKTEVGISDGIGGYALALNLISVYLNEPQYKEMALNIIKLPDNLHEISKIDCFGGLAGYITAACSVKADPRLIEQAANRLMDLRISYNALKVWKNGKAQKPLIGLGHGLSGVALALSMAYRILQKKEYLQAAEEALKYENLFYDKKFGWPDLRDDRSGYMCGICSGAPGIGITRLNMLGTSFTLDKYLDCDIINAIRHSKDNFPLNKDDLCCGNCSVIDFLITAGRKYKRKEILTDSGKMLSWIIEQKNKIGEYRSVVGTAPEPIGFFDGICGIGYEFLRQSDDRIKGIFDFSR